MGDQDLDDQLAAIGGDKLDVGHDFACLGFELCVNEGISAAGMDEPAKTGRLRTDFR
ncbi:hypothetical protein D3C80_1799630 [compost metagenome]